MKAISKSSTARKAGITRYKLKPKSYTKPMGFLKTDITSLNNRNSKELQEAKPPRVPVICGAQERSGVWAQGSLGDNLSLSSSLSFSPFPSPPPSCVSVLHMLSTSICVPV